MPTFRSIRPHRLTAAARRRAALAAIAAVVTVTALTTPRSVDAMRHLRLLRSFPARDTTLTTTPDSIRLWLSEPGELVGTRVALTGAGGAVVKTGKPRRASTKGAPITASVDAPLAPGRYQVAWRTMSKDGHVVKDSFAFAVRAR